MAAAVRAENVPASLSPNAKIKVITDYDGETTSSFHMPLHEEMTFKWLALATSQRFCNNRPIRGALRHRDVKPQRRYGDMLLPEIVCSPDGEEIYDPDAKLIDHLKEDQAVLIRLEPRQKMNEITGASHISPWSFIAFRRGEESKSERERLRGMLNEENGLRQKEKMDALTATASNTNDGTASAKISMMKRIMHQQMISEAHTLANLERDWAKMKRFQKLDTIIVRPWEQEKVKALLLEHYPLITELFRHFASSSSSDINLTIMNYREFMAFVQIMGLITLIAEDQDHLERIFLDSFDTRLCEDQRRQMQLHLHEFFLALVQLAYTVYVDKPIGQHLPRLPLKDIGRRRSALLASTGQARHKVEDAFRRLLHEHLIPYAVKNLTTFVVKQAIASPDVLMLMADLHEQLTQIYKFYSRISATDFLQKNLMDVKEFFVMARDCKLLDKDFDERVTPIEVKDVKHSFAFVQTYDPKSIQAGDDDAQMTYPEWLEGICRLSLLRYDDSDMAVSEKLRLGLNAVMCLARADNKASGGSTAGAQVRGAGRGGGGEKITSSKSSRLTAKGR